MNSGRKLTAARWLPVITFLGAALAAGLELRSYQAERHDRFTGFPAAPAFNDAAYYGSRKFSGVGWEAGVQNGRQFALVSPGHVLAANHFAPGDGTVIRFLNADGIVVERTVIGREVILSDAGLATDVCLVKLSAPVTEAEKVAHFPYLNLASETAYVGTELTVFGWSVKAGRGAVQSIEDSSITGINTTRVMRFRYRKSFGNQDDAYVVVGDSGSPTFGMAGGNPAVLGLHTAAGETDQSWLGYDSFIPHYAAKLDERMAADGYRMTPAYPPAVTLSAAMVIAEPLRQAYPGNCRFDLVNSGAEDAGNVRMTFHFPAGQGPDAMSVPGWIAEVMGPDDWVFRKANLEAGGSSQATAAWAAVPEVSSMVVEMSRVADGSPKAIQWFTLAVTPTFRAWADGLVDASEQGDPDGDGVVNLLEYAFGGDPEAADLRSAAGGTLLPEISMNGGMAELKFPVREDAAARGLTYEVEFSETLEAGEWSAGTMVVADETAEYQPEVSGYLLRTVAWDAAAAPKLFARVRVELAE